MSIASDIPATLNTFDTFTAETPIPFPQATSSPSTIDLSIANKENIPPRWCSITVTSGGKKKNGRVVYEGGVSKKRLPLAAKMLKKQRKSIDLTLETVQEMAEILTEGVETNVFNNRAKGLTQLPLGDLSEAYVELGA